MKTFAGMILGFLLTGASASALEASKSSVGADVALPYVLTRGGGNVTERGNMTLGVHGGYQWTDKIFSGLRLDFDLEGRQGSKKQIRLAPGFQYHWLPLERFDPYFRADLPVALRPEQDMGVSSGVGVLWKLGGGIGLPGLVLRYDFSVQYHFGFGAAPRTLGLELARFGLDYQF